MVNYWKLGQGIKDETDIKEFADMIKVAILHDNLNLDYDKIINKYLAAKDNKNMKNPLMNYTCYLVFESVVLEYEYRHSWDRLGEGPHLPLWVIHNCSQSMNEVNKSHYFGVGDDFYNSYKNNSDNLDFYGEFGEFAIFVEELLKKVVFWRDDEIWGPQQVQEYKDFIINPDWEDVLKKLPEDEQQKWNTFYEPEDWIYHGVV